MWLFGFLAWRGRLGTERSLNCRFPSVEAAVARLAPRPWLMIHGERDTYIGPEIAQDLFDHGEDPKELWLVPNAKHNRCRETAPDAYAAKVLGFLERYAPRRPLCRAGGDRFEAQRADERLRSSAGPLGARERSGDTHLGLTRRVGATAGHDQDAHADDRCACRQASAAVGAGVSGSDPDRRRHPARPALAPAGAARRQPVRARSFLWRDPHAGRFSQARADRRLRPA